MSGIERKALLQMTADRAAQYLLDLEMRSVAADVGAVDLLRQKLDFDLPSQGQSDVHVLEFLDRFGSPATVASAGGRYFGFVTGGAVPASLAANWLANTWDQNGFSSVSSPALAAFEDTALRWLKQALGLPASAGGALVTGATLANFTCLAAARHQVLKNVGWDVEAQGLFSAPQITVVVGEEVHSTVYKVLAMLGLGRDRVLKLPVDDQGCIRADNLPILNGPTILCLQAGNVNSGAFDPAAALIPWARSADAWIHVDGAFGLWAAVSDKHKHLAADFADADSWATDAHKWLNVPYDNGIAIVRDADALHQAMAIVAAYLPPGATRDAIEFTPDSSRRARGVDIWAALASLGQEGLSDLIDRNCRQAKTMATGLQDAGATILNDVVLNQVVVAFDDDTTTHEVIQQVQDDGVCWCGGTNWQGRDAMRISVSSWATTDEDIDKSLTAIVNAFDEVRQTKQTI
ncbi:MAG: aspartate aminotransferase family protein [Alphaproteobacteria bacterium]|jgi:glutamate/tyrosine decarboxylase-like PLP-dependent enzyme|nr:aspartate aminotransferase family protein [Alphaproteobacteria bacterium]MBT4019543.1 aspartate aminotransferase family protein [Alphaproteobacteria bacterium]MBT5158920.1 aspartate aminotransferase family protein [Alphaproteobacteria bacterium]MBT5918632.1 aspartate aminotransferase family protein [Alphaproteobacteria bacterium]MBT6385052.1 aspartate aminotransferase family protein [Alphaproteobacteria bacterium]